MSIEDLSRLEPEIATAPPSELATLLGILERLKALAWARLAMPAVATAPSDDGRLLTMPEVAERLGIKEDLAREMGRRGELPTVAVGERQVRVRPAALDQWVAQRERGSNLSGRRRS